MIKLLSLATFISAVSAIFFTHTGNLEMYTICKPITTILIITISIISYIKSKSTYALLIIGALVFSLIGDLFLIGNNYFLYGLASFLLAHIVFTVAFVKISGFCWNKVIIAILLFIGGLYFNFLKNDLDTYLIPVAIYMTVILIMNWQAIGLVFKKNSSVFLGIALASILFSVSDSILAYNKFVAPFKSADILILSTYWMAIYTFTIAGFYIDKTDVVNSQ